MRRAPLTPAVKKAAFDLLLALVTTKVEEREIVPEIEKALVELRAQLAAADLERRSAGDLTTSGDPEEKFH